MRQFMRKNEILFYCQQILNPDKVSSEEARRWIAHNMRFKEEIIDLRVLG